MSDSHDIWLYPLQDWWNTANKMSDFMPTGQMGNFIFRPVEGIFDVERKDREVTHQSYNLHPVFLAWLPFWPLEANDQGAKER